MISLPAVLTAASLAACSDYGGVKAEDTSVTECQAADEIPYDGEDQDCDGRDLVDVDGDGYDATVVNGSDCDDEDANVYPGAEEVCDEQDNDCDGLVDDQDPDLANGTTWYQDTDGDGYGDAAFAEYRCSQQAGYVEDGTDCDDEDANVYPGAEEVCDERDNDCDGLVDGQDPDLTDGTTWYLDADGDGYGDASISEYRCSQPNSYVADATDCDDGDDSVNPGEAESSDGVDNDCDGSVDEASVALVFSYKCSAEEPLNTQYEADAIETYLDDLGLELMVFEEDSGGIDSSVDLTVYDLAMFSGCGWAWGSYNQASVDLMLAAQAVGIPTFVFGDDNSRYSSVTGAESLVLTDLGVSNGTTSASTGISMDTASTHEAYDGPYGVPPDFTYYWDPDNAPALGAGETILATNDDYGTPAWIVFEDSDGIRSASLFASIYMDARGAVGDSVAESSLEVIFKNTVSWLTDR